MRKVINRNNFLTFSDQAISSLVTFSMSSAVALQSSVAQFGFFALIYAIFWLTLGSVRSIIGELDLLVGENNRQESKNATAVTLIIGIGIFAVATGFVWVIPPENYALYIVFGIVLPCVLALDSVRYSAFVGQKPFRVLILDMIWLVGSVTPLLASWAGYKFPPYLSLTGWAVGAAISLTVSLMLYPEYRPTFVEIKPWVDRRRKLAAGLLADFLASSGIGQLTILGLAAVVNITTVGIYRGSTVLLGPLSVMFSAFTVIIFPHLKEQIKDEKTNRMLQNIKVALFLILVSALTGIFWLLFPEKLGSAILGDSWVEAQSIVLIVALAFGFQAVGQHGVFVLRVQGLTSLIPKVRIWVSPLSGLAVLAGAVMLGPMGAAFGALIGAFASAAVWWGVVHRSSETSI